MEGTCEEQVVVGMLVHPDDISTGELNIVWGRVSICPFTIRLSDAMCRSIELQLNYLRVPINLLQKSNVKLSIANFTTDR